MEIAVSNLLPNPFRHLERYPIRRDKVEALKASISSTEFWDNLIARPAESNGHFELAYGHHRLAALKELEVPTIDIPVKSREKLNNEMMLKVMAHENMEEWGASALIEQETVRAVVGAFAEGKIELGSVSQSKKQGHLQVRKAPGFVLQHKTDIST